MQHHVFLLSLGGLLGVSGRYFLELELKKHASAPMPILFINIIGCFLMGVFYFYYLKHHLSQNLYHFIAIGVLGGFTTFSSYALDILKKHQETEALSKILCYFFISPLLGVGACFAAYYILKTIYK